MDLDGLLPFPLTPFTADDRIDLRAYEEHLRAQLASGPRAGDRVPAAADR